jgi:hypothetical protein
MGDHGPYKVYEGVLSDVSYKLQFTVNIFLARQP